MADKINDGGPAYPVVHRVEVSSGMSLRDAAALAAFQALVRTHTQVDGYWSDDDFARVSWRMADAFIAAREGKTDG